MIFDYKMDVTYIKERTQIDQVVFQYPVDEV